jgi:hypothetical protein
VHELLATVGDGRKLLVAALVAFSIAGCGTSTTTTGPSGSTSSTNSTETNSTGTNSTGTNSTGTNSTGTNSTGTNSTGTDTNSGTGSGTSAEGPGSFTHAGDTRFCSSHSCIPNFPNGNDSVVQCVDGEWSHSGGLSGACSDHGGES